jgi:hypothetical protein
MVDSMLDQSAVSARSPRYQLIRTPLDACRRKIIYGPVRPMERPGFLKRLFGS